MADFKKLPSVNGVSVSLVSHTHSELSSATNANTANTLVKRDASGNFSAGTITASLAGNASTATSTSLLSSKGTYVWTGDSLPSVYGVGVQCSFVQASNGFPNYGSLLHVGTYSNGGGALQLYVPYGTAHGGTGLRVRFGNYSDNNNWTDWKVLLASDNFNSYAPTLTGAGATGTWSINIDGSAVSLTTARTLTIGSTGKTFNGTANVSWSLAEIGAAAVTHTHTSSQITDATDASTANSIVKRNADGDFTGRYVNSTYLNMSHSVATRNSDTVFYSSTDAFVRKNTAAGMVASLGSALTNVIDARIRELEDVEPFLLLGMNQSL